MSDYQRARVYAWEDQEVSPRCHTIVAFANGQTYVDGVWMANGWQRPPQVIYRRATRRVLSCAYHGEVYLPDTLAGWILLHELAHTLTDDQQGPNFVGVYIDLLERVEKLSRLVTMFTLKQAGVDFNLGAQPLEWVIKRT